MLEKLKAFLRLNNLTSDYVSGKTDLLLFSIGGLNYLAEYNKEVDPAFFRIMLPNIDAYSQEKNEMLNNLTSSYKAGKVVVIDNKVWLSVETLVYGNVDASALFHRMITILRDMINEYRRDKNE